MTITYCDRCNSTIPNDTLELIKPRVELDGVWYDLCPECQKSLFKYISYSYVTEISTTTASAAVAANQ